MVAFKSWTEAAVRSEPDYQSVADPPIETDEQLMLQLQQLSVSALRTLCDRYAEIGMGLAMRILGDRELADQVLVEAFWWIWGHPRQNRSARGSFPDLFSAIIWHLALDKLDRQGIGRPPQSNATLGRLRERDKIDSQDRGNCIDVLWWDPDELRGPSHRDAILGNSINN